MIVRIILICLFVAAAAVQCQATGLNCPVDQRETLLAIGEGNLGNRESFPYFRCEFTFTEGTAATVEDGLAGKLTNVVVSHGIWVVDGAIFRYELNCDEELLRKAFTEGSRHPIESSNGGPKLVGVSLPCDPHGFVTNGKIQLRHGPSIQAVNIRSAEVPLPGITITPFSVGVMGENDFLNPGALLTQGGEGSYQFAWIPADDAKSSDGLLSVSFGWGPDENGPTRRTMRLDPDRGFLPVECETFYRPNDQLISQYGNRVSLLKFTKILSVSNQRWFPAHAVVIDHPDSQEAHRTQIVEVTSLDADRRPSPAEFKISIPRGTAIADPSDLRSGFKFNETRGIGPEELEGLLAEAHDVLKRREQGSPLAPVGKPSSFRVLVVGNILVLTAVLVWFLVKERKGSKFQEKGPQQ